MQNRSRIPCLQSPARRSSVTGNPRLLSSARGSSVTGNPRLPSSARGSSVTVSNPRLPSSSVRRLPVSLNNSAMESSECRSSATGSYPRLQPALYRSAKTTRNSGVCRRATQLPVCPSSGRKRGPTQAKFKPAGSNTHPAITPCKRPPVELIPEIDDRIICAAESPDSHTDSNDVYLESPRVQYCAYMLSDSVLRKSKVGQCRADEPMEGYKKHAELDDDYETDLDRKLKDELKTSRTRLKERYRGLLDRYNTDDEQLLDVENSAGDNPTRCSEETFSETPSQIIGQPDDSVLLGPCYQQSWDGEEQHWQTDKHISSIRGCRPTPENLSQIIESEMSLSSGKSLDSSGQPLSLNSCDLMDETLLVSEELSDFLNAPDRVLECPTANCVSRSKNQTRHVAEASPTESVSSRASLKTRQSKRSRSNADSRCSHKSSVTSTSSTGPYWTDEETNRSVQFPTSCAQDIYPSKPILSKYTLGFRQKLEELLLKRLTTRAFKDFQMQSQNLHAEAEKRFKLALLMLLLVAVLAILLLSLQWYTEREYWNRVASYQDNMYSSYSWSWLIYGDNSLSDLLNTVIQWTSSLGSGASRFLRFLFPSSLGYLLSFL